MHQHRTYWEIVWKQFRRHRLGLFALIVLAAFCVVGIYAPLLASSKPLVVKFDGQWYFPLFRYLFFQGFYSKFLDIYYNLLMFTFPLFVMACIAFHGRRRNLMLGFLVALQVGLFLYLVFRRSEDPGASPELNKLKQVELQTYLDEYKRNPSTTPSLLPSWEKELSFLTPYAKLNMVLKYQQRQAQDLHLQQYQEVYEKAAKLKGKTDTAIPSLWHFDRLRQETEIRHQEELINQPETALKAQAQIKYLRNKDAWLKTQTASLQYEVMPLIRPFHWEDDAGGEQDLNQYIGWWDLTRINRKDMVASLIFGIRISLSVGILAIGLALLIGVPLGAIGGYYGGKTDIILYRLIEIWESMPTFFMLLMVVAFLQSKSIFLVIGVIGLFGWTSFSRFIRGEFFKQKQLPYVEACHALGFSNARIMFVHLLPNAIPPLLTLIPFAIMGAITSEAGLSFLGLGEEGSSSWGVLMDEGRSAFPSESYLLWPPAILLTILLVSIAIVGDALRDALDPKMHY